MILCYCYIFEHKNLENIGLSLDTRFDISFDKSDKILHIKKNEAYVENFWPTGIDCISALVGNNGAGKTNALDFIVNNIVSGSGTKAPHGIFVFYDKANNQLHCHFSDREIQIDNTTPITVHQTRHNRSIRTLYYTPHFQTTSSLDELLTVEVSGLTNIRDSFLITHEFQNSQNEVSDHGGYPLRDYYSVYFSQNQFKTALFVSKFHNESLGKSINIPRYILLVPNTSGYRGFKFRKEAFNEELLTVTHPFIDDREKKLIEIICHVLLNMANDRSIYDKEAILSGLSDLAKTHSDKLVQQGLTAGNVLELIRELGFLDWLVLFQLENVINGIARIFKFDERGNNFYFDLEEKRSVVAFQNFIEKTTSGKEWLSGRFYDLICAHSSHGNATVSSGEQQILSLLSRLYYYQVCNPEKISNAYRSELLILDEADVGLHPEWQRQFVYNLTQFLKAIGPGGNCQVILATHSPIMLSDIPKQNVCFLHRTKDGATENSTQNQPETFATNVFHLYRNSFFMSDILGKFATEKIERIIEDIKERRYELLSEHHNTIQLIGDEYIKHAIFKELEKVDKKGAIAILRKQIKELENEQQ